MKVAIGSTGAPTISVANSKGFASIARNGAGDYTITLQDVYVAFLSADSIIQNSTGISASPNMGIKAQAVSTAKTINVIFSTGGTATELASGDTLWFHICLSNSSAP